MKRVSILLLSLFLLGCATQQRLLYNTLATVQMVTTSAYSSYLDLTIQGKIPTNSVPKISADYNAFQTLWSVAVAGAQFNTNTIAPPQVVFASSNILYEIQVAKIKP